MLQLYHLNHFLMHVWKHFLSGPNSTFFTLNLCNWWEKLVILVSQVQANKRIIMGLKMHLTCLQLTPELFEIKHVESGIGVFLGRFGWFWINLGFNPIKFDWFSSVRFSNFFFETQSIHKRFGLVRVNGLLGLPT